MTTRPVGRATARRSKRALAELLEPRQLLTVGVTISEFLASNNAGLTDEDGAHSDWIELHNATAAPVSLNSWYLTDDAADRTKWQFPNVTINADQYLVVFASDKDRRVAGSNLHTNFKLSAGGEYLGLVQPDGATVEFEYAPQFPQQNDDVSYGIGPALQTTALVDAPTSAKFLVPTATPLAGDWRQPGFDDGAWTPVNSGVGYQGAPAGTAAAPIGYWKFEGNGIDASGFNHSAALNGAGVTYSASVPGPIGGSNSLSFSGTANQYAVINPLDVSEAVLTVSLWFQTSSSGRGIFSVAAGNLGVAGHDRNLYLNGTNIAGQLQGQAISSVGKTYTDNAWHHLAYIFQQGTTTQRIYIDGNATPVATGSVSSSTLTTQDRIYLGFSPPAITDYFNGLIDDVAVWNAALSSGQVMALYNGVSPLELPSYAADIATSVDTAMHNVNSSGYLRIPFNVANVDDFDALTLSAKYDDGFVANLNGTEIARRNAPASLAWNSAATASHPNGQATVAEAINVSAFEGALQNGANVLAVQGLNVSASDLDFLLVPTLKGTRQVGNVAQYYATPTPGGPNSLDGTKFVDEPELSVPGGTFQTAFNLSITQANGAQIRYTLDGTTPTASSTLYAGPININANRRVRAIAIEPGGAASAVVEADFTILAANAASFTSNLPIVVLETQGGLLPGSGATNMVGALVSVIDVSAATGRASILGTPDYVGRGGLRQRGSSTGGQAKPSMSFELWDQAGNDLDHELLGMPSDSDWVLYAPFSFDTTLIHEPLMYDLSRDVGQWASRNRIVEVYLNTGGGTLDQADYFGVYILEEKIKRHDDRVDIAAITPADNTQPNVTGGYIWKIDRGDPGEPQFSAGGQTIGWVYPDQPQVTASQQSYVTNLFNSFNTTLNGANFADPVNGYAAYINVDTWIDHHLLNVLSLNVDALRLSAYFYKDRNDKISFGPIWDFDRTLESTDGRDDNPELWKGSGDATDFFNYPWWGRLFDDPNFWQKYIDRWHELRQDVFSTASLNARIDALAAQLTEAAPRNFTRWSITPRYGGWTGEINNLKSWLARRTTFIDNQFAKAVDFSRDSGEVTPGTTFTLTTRGSPIVQDTLLVSGVNGATAMRYLVPTTNAVDATWMLPAFDDASWAAGAYGLGYENSTGYESHITTSVLSQMLNVRTSAYSRATFDVTNPADLPNLMLRMKYDDGFIAYLNGVEVARRNYSGTAVGTPAPFGATASDHPDGSAVVFEDIDITSFKNLLQPTGNLLAIHGMNSSTGSSDFLIQPSLVSRVTTFSEGTGAIYYTTDGSDPRLPGGGVAPNAIAYTRGTPIAINQNVHVVARNLDATNRGSEAAIVLSNWSAPTSELFVTDQPASLRVTEINYNPVAPSIAELAINPAWTDDDFEYIELQNVGVSSIDVSGAQFSAGIAYTFPAGTLVNPGGFVVVARNPSAFQARYANAVTPRGPFAGALDNGGEELQLIDQLGVVIQQFTYDDDGQWPGRADGLGATLEVISTAGDYNTADSWNSSDEYGGSPGTQGAGPIDDVVVNEVLSHSDAPLVDTIELHNVSAAAIDIGGWYLSDSSGNYKKYRIPNGTLLPAGGYVTFDESDFNPTPATPGPNDFSLNGAHGDDVWLMKADAAGKLLRFVDDVEFDAAASGESWGRWPNGAGDLYPMVSRTVDGANSGPRIGPVVISELMYNPNATLADDDLEYIELANITNTSVDIAGWKIEAGIDFTLSAGAVLPSFGKVVVARFNPSDPLAAAKLAAFQAAYGSGMTLVGGYVGVLDDGGETVQLVRPDASPPDEPLFVPYLLVDEVKYDDVSPWPTGPDGTGQSLSRLGASVYGREPSNWTGAAPNPGAFGASVVGRHVFYNNSAWDGNDATANALDDAAIATDKTALLPGGAATLANYTSYNKGINGVMIDVAHLAGTITAADFAFKTGNSNDTNTWTALTTAPSLLVRPGAGTGGSTRVTLTWLDNTIKKQWLQVRVLANSNTGLAGDDVSYFGNAVGEAGNAVGDAQVNAADELGARGNPRNIANPAPITFLYDYNRDKQVNAADQLISRGNPMNLATRLLLILPTAGAGGPAGAGLAEAALGEGELADAIDVLALRRRR